jgi:hypothetical protein
MSFEHFFGKLQMTVGKTMRDGDLEKQMMQWFRPSTFRHLTRNDMKWTSHRTGCSYDVAGESTDILSKRVDGFASRELPMFLLDLTTRKALFVNTNLALLLNPYLELH